MESAWYGRSASVAEGRSGAPESAVYGRAPSVGAGTPAGCGKDSVPDTLPSPSQPLRAVFRPRAYFPLIAIATGLKSHFLNDLGSWSRQQGYPRPQVPSIRIPLIPFG